MQIKTTLNTKDATYDLTGLTNQEFSVLCKAYEHYMYYIRHCPPDENDSMWSKMRKILGEKITIL